MKTRQVTVYEGEYLGPVDWGFNFAEFYRPYYNCSKPEVHDQRLQEAIEKLRVLEACPDEYEATTDGGWPRCGWGEILQVGMYDGWPYWRPVPSVCIRSWTGHGVWSSFASITSIRRKGVKS